MPLPLDSEKSLRELLRSDRAQLGAAVEPLRPADLADWLETFTDEDTWDVFQACQLEQRAEVLEEADDSLRQRLLRLMDAADLIELVDELPPDEVVDLLALADEDVTEQVLESVDLEVARDLRHLASYEPDTAGGEMTTEFVAVEAHTHVGDAIKLVRSAEEDSSEEGVGVFVLDSAGHPIGFASDHALLTQKIHQPIGEVMETDLVTVSAEEDREEAAKLVAKYSLHAIPVVDRAGRMIGILNADDALEVLEEEASEDMVRLAGASEAHQTRLPILKRVRTRLPLMAITVGGGLLTAWILDQAFGDTETSIWTDILRYLPIIIGLAGNVGIQSSTILVRGFATGEVEPQREASVLLSEVLVGFVIGVLCGVITGLFAWQFESSLPESFGLALGIAVLVAVGWASLLGCLVPITCRRLGIDPAIVAGPFLITLSDVSGSAIFVVVARWIMTLAS